MTLEDLVPIENYEWTPNEKIVFKIDNVLNLHIASLITIATTQWDQKTKPLIQIALILFVSMYLWGTIL
jgi:hypothetical protein